MEKEAVAALSAQHTARDNGRRVWTGGAREDGED